MSIYNDVILSFPSPILVLTKVLLVVYVLDEIAELANGGGEVAQGLADSTIRRLGNKSPIVKQKVRQEQHLQFMSPSCSELLLILGFKAHQACDKQRCL